MIGVENHRPHVCMCLASLKQSWPNAVEHVQHHVPSCKWRRREFTAHAWGLNGTLGQKTTGF
eukprot:1362310-Amphidinium_carterae.1